MRILIAEDEKDLNRIISSRLSQEHYSVDSCFDGEEALEYLESAAIDENRIAAEVTIYADKICVDEEMVRLRSHIESTKAKLLAGGTVGRELDFIAQEMNREANTTLSKSTDLEISDRAIALKTEVEKVREQIQNIE